MLYPKAKEFNCEITENDLSTWRYIRDLGLSLYGLKAGGNMADAVASPKHYTQGRLEVIYQIADTLGPEGFKAYCLGNVKKYISRHAAKNGDEDLKKAHVYLGWAINGLPPPENGRLPA